MIDRKYDVAVIGGGVAGTCAGITAARKGLRTILIEERGNLGGTVVAGLQRYICGLYANDTSKPFTILNMGISLEIIEMLDRRQPGDNRLRMGKAEVHSFDTVHLEAVLTELTKAENNLEVRLLTTLHDLDCKDGSITSLRLRSEKGNATVAADYIIDCSGRGAAIQICKAFEDETPDSEHQLSGCSIYLTNIAYEDDQLPVKVPYFVRKAVDEGRLDRRLCVTTFSECLKQGTGICRINVSRAEVGQNELQPLCSDLHEFLCETLKEFSNSTIEGGPPSLLDRDGIVLKGQYRLTADDVTGAASFNDAVAKCAWPVEFWHKTRGPSYIYLEEGSFYQIPGRCLKADKILNLYAAGRCISADLEALASCRTSGTCMVLGEAASNMIYSELRERRS